MTSGEILLEDYMKPMGLTQNALARALGVPPRWVNEIMHGKRVITLDTLLRLGRNFGQPTRKPLADSLGVGSCLAVVRVAADNGWDSITLQIVGGRAEFLF